MKQRFFLITILVLGLALVAGPEQWVLFSCPAPCDVSPALLIFPGSGVDRVVMVRNPNPNPFTLRAVNSDNPAFAVVATSQPLPATLLPQGTITVTVRFTCPQRGFGEQAGALRFTIDPAGAALCGSVGLMSRCGSVNPCQATVIPVETGGTVIDPRIGAAIEIPPHTLKKAASVKVIPLTGAGPSCPPDNRGDVPVQPGESFPDVPGFIRATEVIRYEVDPPGLIAFGPGTRITLPLRQSLFPAGLPLATPPLRLFQLGRMDGRLIFLDTGIIAKVIGPSAFLSSGDFVIAPDIQVFGTFAAFIPQGSLTRLSSHPLTSVRPPPPPTMAQPSGRRLFFPLINQTGRQTRISIANPALLASLTVLFTAYDDSGGIIGTQERTVPANRNESFPVSELFPGIKVGAIVAQQQGGAMTGFYEIADNFVAPMALDGAEGIETPHPVLIFPIIKSQAGGFTEIHVFNSNDAPVSLRLAGFTASGNHITPVNSAGQPLATILVPAFGKLVVFSNGVSSTHDLQLDFTALDGGSLIIETTDGQTVTGAELFGEGEAMKAQPNLAVLNALSFPVGCLSSTSDPCACHVDLSPGAPVPSATRQHTLYATFFEEGPGTESMLQLVNVSDSAAPIAVSAFSPEGRFLKTFPRTDFLMLNPHQALQVSVLREIGLNPGAGYLRVEDPNSSVVGAIINRVINQDIAAVPIMLDDPRLAQSPTVTFLSRIQLDPATAENRLVTGLPILNPNNNPVQFKITVTDENGMLLLPVTGALVARGTFVRLRQSLSVLFPSVVSGFAKVEVTGNVEPGEGGRLIPIGVYRSKQVLAATSSQNVGP